MINDLISFLNASPVNFLAVHTLAARLEQAICGSMPHARWAK